MVAWAGLGWLGYYCHSARAPCCARARARALVPCARGRVSEACAAPPDDTHARDGRRREGRADLLVAGHGSALAALLAARLACPPRRVPLFFPATTFDVAQAHNGGGMSDVAP